MGRTNKLTLGVFTSIIGDHRKIPEYDIFIGVQSDLHDPSKELKSYTDKYKKMVTENKPTFEKLAKMEDVIMQLRIRDNISIKDIKLNVVRDYIYARIPFHRTDKDGKDVRVIVGTIEEYGKDIDNLFGNKEFMEKGKNKLIQSMNTFINESILELKV